MFTADQYVIAVREVLKERGPDYVYRSDTGCYYRPDVEGFNNAMCLHGAAFHKLGVLDDERIVEGRAIDDILADFGIDEFFVVDAAKRAQRAQDNGFEYDVVAHRFEDSLSQSGIQYGTEK